MNKQDKYILTFFIFCILAFLSYLSFFQIKGKNIFYQKKLYNVVDEVRITPKGCLEIRIDTSWFDFGVYSGYIDSIQRGDSIFKEADSYEIIVKRKNDNFKTYKYDCSY